MRKIWNKILIEIKKKLEKIKIPFLGVSLYKMFEIYGKGLFHNQIGKQAASISWSFFLSLFPFILFMLSMLPYLPHYEELQFYILEIFLPKILPENILVDVLGYIKNFLIPNLKNINNTFTIFFALIFGTNGTYSLINGFNENTTLKRNFIKEYIISIMVTIGFVLLVALSILGIYYSEIVLGILKSDVEELSWFMDNLSKIIGFFSFPILYVVLLSLFYWVGCLKIKKWKYALPGAIFTTILFVLVTYFFAIYLKNFARYNVFYGSIGSIIVFMIWVNVNIILILLGNELNISIYRIKKMQKEEMIKLE